MVIDINPEFGCELVLVVPYVHHLHKNGKDVKVRTSKGMKPFYYFSILIVSQQMFRRLSF